MKALPTCPLCTRQPLTEIWSNAQLRIIDAQDPDFPGFTRVVWHEHVSEMTDLNNAQRRHLMDAVWVVETVLRDVFSPVKINVAQLGNQVPHIHWHVIPRWPLDTRYPDAVWAPAKASTPERALAWDIFKTQQANALPHYHHALRQALDTLPALQT